MRDDAIADDLHEAVPLEPDPGDVAVREVALPWLVQLRWGVSVGQLAAALYAFYFLTLAVSVAVVVGVVALTALSNLWLSRAARRDLGRAVRWLPGLLVLDTLTLTAVLTVSGGPANPFSVLYTVHVIMAVIVFEKVWTWAMTAVSLACYGLLFVPHPWTAGGHVHPEPPAGDPMDTHYVGMWFALSLALLLAGHFAGRVLESFRAQADELQQMRTASAKNARLASLTTLAAGAAHELGSPLTTIAVAVHEIARSIDAESVSPQTLEDVQLIRSEVDRCREILDRMHTSVSSDFEPALREVSREELEDDLHRLLGVAQSRRVRIDWACDEATVRLPWNSVAPALIALLRNSIDASDAASPVWMEVAREDDQVCFTVHDRGEGIPPRLLARVEEPFVTTKPPGRGMGLGLFFVRVTAERLGGGFLIDSEPGRGTRARLRIPELQS